MKEDLYKILEIDRNASADDIKKAYRKLSKKYHPDVSKEAGAEDKFKKISEAYSILSDPQKKSKYDRYGDTDGFSNSGGGGFGGFGGFADIFEQFTNYYGNPRGGGRGRRANPVGSNLNIKVSVAIEEIIFGVKKKIKYKRNKKCEPCDGQGGEDLKTCQQCSGTGIRVDIKNTHFGQIRQEYTCNVCNGNGSTISKNCVKCSGRGYIDSEEIIDIEIPPGATSDIVMSMSGYGHYARGGTYGDLQIKIDEMPGDYFRREGIDIIINKKIPVIDAIIGENVKIKTPRGEKIVSIEPGTQNGHRYTFNGEGIPVLNSNRVGSLHIFIGIDIPKNINLEEKKILQKLRNSKNFS
jgi:molecular chaperone DnaJ